MERRLFVVAALGTLCYLGVLGWGMETRLDQIQDLDLNELGDFLAGVFSPLAFWWLVIGYLLQGSELKASRDALLLQAQELKNSVEQQRELVNVTREQLEAEREARQEEFQRVVQQMAPNLLIERGGIRRNPMLTAFSFELKNYGGKATSVKLFGNIKPLAGLPISMDSMPTGFVLPFTITLGPDDSLFLPLTIGIFYMDGLHNQASIGFRFSLVGEGVRRRIDYVPVEWTPDEDLD